MLGTVHSSIRLGQEYLTGLYLPHAGVTGSDFPGRNRSTPTNSSLSSPAWEPLVSLDTAYEVNFTLSSSIPASGPDASRGEMARTLARTHTYHTCALFSRKYLERPQRRGAADNERSVILYNTSHCCPLPRFIWSPGHRRSQRAREGNL